MKSNLVNLTGALNGVFQGNTINKISNCCCINLIADNIIFVNNKYLLYDPLEGIFTTKGSGVYKFRILFKCNNFSNRGSYVKLALISLKNGIIAHTDNILKGNLDMSLEIDLKANVDDNYKVIILLSNKRNIAYEGSIYVDYSLNSI